MNPVVPEAERSQFTVTTTTAQTRADAGFAGLAVSLIEAARRRAEQAAAARQSWATPLMQEQGRADERFHVLSGTPG